MKPILGVQLKKLELLAVVGTTVRPIPFQVDERLADGSFALPYGPQPVADDSPGVLDADDELAMMISDLGDCDVDARLLPNRALEIRAIDPLGGRDRCAYLAVVERPILSSADYVDYDPQRTRIESDHYRIGFTQEFPHDFALQSHKGENRPSLTDEFMVRVSARIFNYFEFKMTEHHDRARLLAYGDGPIRVIRRVAHWVPLMFGLRSPYVIVQEIFYRDYNEGPFQVRFPWVPRFVFGDIKVMLGLDFVDASDYWLLWSGMTGPPVRIGDVGSLRDLERSGHLPEINWVAIRGEHRIVLQTFKPTPDLMHLRQRLYLQAGANLADKAEASAQKSVHTAVGATLTGWEELSSGWHYFNVVVINVPDSYSPQTIVAELLQEPIIKLRIVSQ